MLLIRRLEGFKGTHFSAHVPIAWYLRQYMVTRSKKAIDMDKKWIFQILCQKTSTARQNRVNLLLQSNNFEVTI